MGSPGMSKWTEDSQSWNADPGQPRSLWDVWQEETRSESTSGSKQWGGAAVSLRHSRDAGVIPDPTIPRGGSH